MRNHVTGMKKKDTLITQQDLTTTKHSSPGQPTEDEWVEIGSDFEGWEDVVDVENMPIESEIDGVAKKMNISEEIEQEGEEEFCVLDSPQSPTFVSETMYTTATAEAAAAVAAAEAEAAVMVGAVGAEYPQQSKQKHSQSYMKDARIAESVKSESEDRKGISTHTDDKASTPRQAEHAEQEYGDCNLRQEENGEALSCLADTNCASSSTLDPGPPPPRPLPPGDVSVKSPTRSLRRLAKPPSPFNRVNSRSGLPCQLKVFEN